jgi:hypothetical protein
MDEEDDKKKKAASPPAPRPRAIVPSLYQQDQKIEEIVRGAATFTLDEKDKYSDEQLKALRNTLLNMVQAKLITRAHSLELNEQSIGPVAQRSEELKTIISSLKLETPAPPRQLQQQPPPTPQQQASQQQSDIPVDILERKKSWIDDIVKFAAPGDDIRAIRAECEKVCLIHGLKADGDKHLTGATKAAFIRKKTRTFPPLPTNILPHRAKSPPRPGRLQPTTARVRTPTPQQQQQQQPSSHSGQKRNAQQAGIPQSPLSDKRARTTAMSL